MTWLGANVIETSPSGLPYDFIEPDAKNIKMLDIAFSLSQNCRFGNFASPFYSVSTHSCLVADIVQTAGGELDEVRGAFMHDAHEAYLGDCPRPMKPVLPEFSGLVKIADKVIGEAFDLDPKLFKLDIVKWADNLALVHEGNAVMPRGPGDVSERLPRGLRLELDESIFGMERFLSYAKRLGIIEVL